MDLELCSIKWLLKFGNVTMKVELELWVNQMVIGFWKCDNES